MHTRDRDRKTAESENELRRVDVPAALGSAVEGGGPRVDRGPGAGPSGDRLFLVSAAPVSAFRLANVFRRPFLVPSGVRRPGPR